MTTIPSNPSEYQIALVEIFSEAFQERLHPFQALEWGAIRDNWQIRGFEEEDFIRTKNKMISDGAFKEEGARYFFTDLAVTNHLFLPPNLQEIEDAILEQFRLNNCHAGDDLLTQDISMLLLNDGFTEADLDIGYKSLRHKNQITSIGNKTRLI